MSIWYIHKVQKYDLVSPPLGTTHRTRMSVSCTGWIKYQTGTLHVKKIMQQLIMGKILFGIVILRPHLPTLYFISLFSWNNLNFLPYTPILCATILPRRYIIWKMSSYCGHEYSSITAYWAFTNNQSIDTLAQKRTTWTLLYSALLCLY